MGKNRRKNFLLAVKKYFFIFLLPLFFVACGGDDNFHALNSNEKYFFSYNGFEKKLFLNQKEDNFALVFFTKDCGVCREQIPILEKIAGEFNFKIFLILGDASSAADAAQWAREKGLESLPLFFVKNEVRFLSSAVGGIYGVPVLVFFRGGRIHEKFIGLTPLGILRSEVKKII